MTEWPYVRLEGLASADRWAFSIGPFGSKVTTDDYRAEGVPFIRGVNLARGVFHDDDFVFIGEDKCSEIESAVVQPGDLVFTRKGTIGQVSMIPRKSKFGRYAISGSQVKARLDPTRAVAEFYYYWFASPMGRQSLLAHAVTTGVPSLANSLSTIRGIEVPHPPLGEQFAVAGALQVLDDKISANERIAATARALGEAIFSEAVDAISQSVKLKSIATYINRGQAPKYTNSTDGLTVVNQKCIRAGRVSLAPARLTEAARVHVDRRLLRNDILVNSTGVGTLGRVGIWSHNMDATVDSHVTIVRIDSGVIPSIVGAFAMLTMQGAIEAMGEGSTGQTELSRAKLGEVEIRLPSGENTQLAQRLTALEEKADAALTESGALVALRDTLLPQLMSGKLRVRDAERIVEDAV